MSHTDAKVLPFLTFSGQATRAMDFYTSLFRNSGIISRVLYGAGEFGKEGTVMQGAFSIKGQTVLCVDSAVEHAFAFTPAISLYVSCDTEEEIALYFGELSRGGHVNMPLDAYPFSEKFGWVNDRFGVSWQLNLRKSAGE